MEQLLIGSILGLSVADDFKNRKVHNVLILVFLLFSFSYFLLASQFHMSQLQSLGVCSVLCLPLVYLRILGAGDYKLLMVIALFLTPTMFINLFAFSLIWNAIAGSLKFLVGYLRGDQNKKDHLRFPFTVGILIAWLSLSYLPQGFSLW